jgi:hypothetical protein
MYKVLLDYLLARAKEPSTYAGLGALLAAVGLHFSSTDVSALVQACVAVAGAAAVVLAEKGIA